MQYEYSFEGQERIPSPQLICYQDAIESNLKHMIVLSHGAEKLWPHVKTHKMIEVVKLAICHGITSFKCATIAEAEMCGMAEAEKVLLSYPLLGPNVERFFSLMKHFPKTKFYAMEDDFVAVCALSDAAVKGGVTVSLLMDVDLGQDRTGMAMDKAADAYEEWTRLPGICMAGLHCYDGHRHESDPNERLSLVAAEDEGVKKLKKTLSERGLACEFVILGGTPSFPCHVEQMPDDFYSPGTCVLWDFGYDKAYPDLAFTPAAAVLVRVVSRRGDDRMTLDLGTKAVASDPLGERASLVGFEDAVTVLQNEEHWVVRVPKKKGRTLPPVGTVLFAIPAHVCPTSALYPEACVVENGKWTGTWKVTARDRKITI
ncbi:MAG: D-TA family PLP-dependent enzyme [Lachnospiraceae bacterium]|nr:D-TA family PLP-dependent enzyme [Lachnospiraceae bacterium]